MPAPGRKRQSDWTGCAWVLESRALRGAVAQLGERRVRNAKVEGSIPFRSTINSLSIPKTWVMGWTLPLPSR